MAWHPGLTGRPKGCPNKSSAALKAMVLGALDELGGQPWLVEQARANPVAFLSLLGKLLPRHVDIDLAPMRLDEMSDEQLYTIVGEAAQLETVLERPSGDRKPSIPPPWGT